LTFLWKFAWATSAALLLPYMYICWIRIKFHLAVDFKNSVKISAL
jgi:hypothetical protein